MTLEPHAAEIDFFEVMPLNHRPHRAIKDEDALLAFYDFPAEHWQHIRTSNPIESTFATVRHRTTRTRNCVSRDTFLGLAFKLIEEAEKSWNKIHSADKVAALLQGTVFKNGEAVQDNQPPVNQKLAA